jgi:hypothetical protein
MLNAGRCARCGSKTDSGGNCSCNGLGRIVERGGVKYRVAHETLPLTVTTPKGRRHTPGHLGLIEVKDPFEAVLDAQRALRAAIGAYKAERETVWKAELAPLWEALGDWEALPHRTVVSAERHALSGFWTLEVVLVDEAYRESHAGGKAKILSHGVRDDVDGELKPEIVRRWRELFNTHLDERIDANRACGMEIWTG